jgi:hypothetical protein
MQALGALQRKSRRDPRTLQVELLGQIKPEVRQPIPARLSVGLDNGF